MDGSLCQEAQGFPAAARGAQGKQYFRHGPRRWGGGWVSCTPPACHLKPSVTLSLHSVIKIKIEGKGKG